MEGAMGHAPSVDASPPAATAAAICALCNADFAKEADRKQCTVCRKTVCITCSPHRQLLYGEGISRALQCLTPKEKEKVTRKRVCRECYYGARSDADEEIETRLDKELEARHLRLAMAFYETHHPTVVRARLEYWRAFCGHYSTKERQLRLANAFFETHGIKMYMRPIWSHWRALTLDPHHVSPTITRLLAQQYTKAELHRCWDCWWWFAHDCVHQDDINATIANYLLRMRDRKHDTGTTSGALAVWRAMCKQHHGALMAINRWKAGQLHGTVLVWRADASLQKRLKKHIAAIFNKQRFQVWHRWRKTLTEMHHHEQIGQRVLAKMSHRLTSMSCQQWRHVVSEKLAARDLYHAAVREFQRRAHIPLWLQWRKCCDESKRQKQTIRVCVQRMMNTQLHATFFGWRSTASVVRQGQRIMLSVVRNMKNRRVSSVWRQWRHSVADSKKQAQVASLAFSKWKNSMLNKAFLPFRLHADAASWRKSVIDVVIRKMKNSKLCAAFYRWKSHVAQLIHQTQRATSFLIEFTMQKLQVAWLQWRLCAKEVLLQKTHLGSAMSKMQNRSVTAAWTKWRHETATSRFELKTLNALLFKSTFWLNEALMRWRNVVEVAVFVRQQTNKALRKLRNVSLHTAWISWQLIVQIANSQRKTIISALRKLQNNTMHVAWHSWRGAAEAALALNVSVEKTAVKMKNSTLLAAWQRWLGVVNATQKDREATCKAQTNMSEAKLAAAWSHWRALVEQHEQQTGLISKSLKKLRKRQLWIAWQRWKSIIELAWHQKTTVKHALMKLHSSKLLVSWGQWQDFVLSTLNTKDGLIVALSKMQQAKLTIAWNTWLSHALTSASQKKMIETALLKLSNRLIAAAWVSWKAVCDGWRSKRGARLAALTFRHRTCRQAFWKWLETATGFMLHGRLVVEHWLNSVVPKAWHHWRQYSRESKAYEVNAVRDQAAMRWNKSLTLTLALIAFKRWRKTAATEFYFNETMEYALYHVDSRYLQAAWDSWKDLKIKAMQELQTLVFFRKQQASRHVLARWKAFCVEEAEDFFKKRSLNLKAQAMLKRMTQPLLYSAMRQMLEHRNKARKLHSQMKKAMQHYRCRMIFPRWCLWQEQTIETLVMLELARIKEEKHQTTQRRNLRSTRVIELKKISKEMAREITQLVTQGELLQEEVRAAQLDRHKYLEMKLVLEEVWFRLDDLHTVMGELDRENRQMHRASSTDPLGIHNDLVWAELLNFRTLQMQMVDKVKEGQAYVAAVLLAGVP